LAPRDLRSPSGVMGDSKSAQSDQEYMGVMVDEISQVKEEGDVKLEYATRMVRARNT